MPTIASPQRFVLGVNLECTVAGRYPNYSQLCLQRLTVCDHWTLISSARTRLRYSQQSGCPATFTRHPYLARRANPQTVCGPMCQECNHLLTPPQRLHRMASPCAVLRNPSRRLQACCSGCSLSAIRRTAVLPCPQLNGKATTMLDTSIFRFIGQTRILEPQGAISSWRVAAHRRPIVL